MIQSRQTRRAARTFLWIAAGLVVVPPVLQAQEANGSFMAADLSHAAVAPRAMAARTDQPIQIDGNLDEAAWSSAEVITRFTQLDPNEGEPVSERTEVRVIYDGQALYLGALLHDTGPLSTVLARRDASMSESDIFAVVLDSYHDHQTAYRFATNPSGMKHDQLISSGQSDSSWDPVWDVATSVTAEGWAVEIRIPFSQLRFSPDAVQTWGIQIERTIRRKQEEAVFAFTPRLESSGVHRFGHLDGIREIRSGQRLELLPYMAGRAEYVQGLENTTAGFSNPYESGSAWLARAGLDLKFRVSSNITLDATVNPDFGQVEVDPAVINLTAFETRFEEKRPFFVEGAEIFRFSEGGPRGSVGNMPELLYSRRIGRSPQGAVPSSAVFSDAPTATTILGAAKVTAKIGEGWSVGVLEAVTGQETARFVDPAGVHERTVVEPATNYLVSRVRRDSRGGSTRMGSIFTAVNRDVSNPVIAGRLHSAAYSGGVDLVHQWADRTWRFNSSVSSSYVAGDAAAITRTQRAAARYFNRPDADHLQLDPDATSLAGYFAMAMVEKMAGTWTGRLGAAVASPGYEVNDMGFQTAADRIMVDTHLQYNQLSPGRYLRNWSIFGGPNSIWNYTGDYILDNTNLNGRVQFANYWSSNFRVSYVLPTYNDRLTRGGPLARNPQAWQGNFGFNTDSRKAYIGRASIRGTRDDAGSWERVTSVNVNYKPRENWEFLVGPQLSRGYSVAQYVSTVTDPAATNTYGGRYIFAGLDHTTLGIETRVNVTFSPTLSLQMYTQPFISSGQYGSLKELKAPKTFDFLTYGEDRGSVERLANGHFRIDPDGDGPAGSFQVRDLDFNYRSLLGNAVLRWEWRAGSTLFLVWQQSRAARDEGMDYDTDLHGVGRFEFWRDTREMVGIQPNNIFAIKLNYWLNP